MFQKCLNEIIPVEMQLKYLLKRYGIFENVNKFLTFCLDGRRFKEELFSIPQQLQICVN